MEAASKYTAVSYAVSNGHAEVLRLLLAARAEAGHAARVPLEALAGDDDMRRLLRSEVKVRVPRQRQVVYKEEDVLDILWHREGKEISMSVPRSQS